MSPSDLKLSDAEKDIQLKNKWQGLARLLQDAVEKSAAAIEEVHLKVANEPLDMFAKIPPAAPAAACVRHVLNTGIHTSYELVRTVNREVGNLAVLALGKAGDRISGSCNGPSTTEGEGGQ